MAKKLKFQDESAGEDIYHLVFKDENDELIYVECNSVKDVQDELFDKFTTSEEEIDFDYLSELIESKSVILIKGGDRLEIELAEVQKPVYKIITDEI